MIVTVTEAECAMEPLVAVILTLYVPGAALPVVTFRVELDVPLDTSVTVTGLTLADGPVGETDTARLSVPENPLKLVKPTVDVPEDPWEIVKELELVEREKSGFSPLVTVTVTVVERESGLEQLGQPTDPVTVAT